MPGQGDLYSPNYVKAVMKEEELPAENIWVPEKVQEFVEDAAYTEETWIIKQDVVCAHKIIYVWDAILSEGNDKYEKKVISVKEVKWIVDAQILKDEQYQTATAEYLTEKMGWDVARIRMIIASEKWFGTKDEEVA